MVRPRPRLNDFEFWTMARWTLNSGCVIHSEGDEDLKECVYCKLLYKLDVWLFEGGF